MDCAEDRVRLLDDEITSALSGRRSSLTGRPPPIPTGCGGAGAGSRADEAILSMSSAPNNYGAVWSANFNEHAVSDRGRRRPYHYHNVPGTNRYKSDSGTDASDTEVTNYNRFTYISRVMSSSRLATTASATSVAASRSDSELSDTESVGLEQPHFTIPSHLIPAEFFIPSFVAPPQPCSGQQPKNSSLVTVFAIWNTMMGTSILSMPWLVEQSGLVAAVLVFVLMTAVCVFTAFRVLTMHSCLQVAVPMNDFQCVMRRVLSKYWEYLGIVFSVCVLVGAMLVYWVLMSNFLYNSVEYFHDLVCGNFSGFSVNSTVIHGGYCPEDEPIHVLGPIESQLYSKFAHVWTHTMSALVLMFFLFPVLNIKSPTFFTKFTGLGTISVLYMTVFVTVKSTQFGINMNFFNPDAFDYVHLFRLNFPVAMGTLSLAMFIHNCICRIMEDNARPENNVRDLFIAYFLVFITYFYIGLLFFMAWPFAKSCIRDNFLDNFVGTDKLSVVARIFLFFQMFTVFPLLGFMIRVQLMNFIYGSSFPGRFPVAVLNTALVVGCVLVTIFYPFIGQLLRFSGAFCGMAWVFTFPCTVYLVGKYRSGRLSVSSGLLHSFLIAMGLANLVLQFVVKAD